jgi:hypothetical protein
VAEQKGAEQKGAEQKGAEPKGAEQKVTEKEAWDQLGIMEKVRNETSEQLSRGRELK